MKKLLSLLILMFLFIPTFVFAKSDVEIKSIERIDITSGVNEISDPSFNGLDVEFKLQFLTQGDYVKYNITLINNSSKDYQISDDVANFKVSDYIDYSFSFDNNNGVVKANSEKVITVTISYKKAVEETNLTNGRFIEDNSLSIKLANGNINNPNTGRTVLFVFIGLFVGGILFFIFRDRSNILLPIIILVLFIPVISYALDIIQINIDSHVEVDGSCPYRIVTDRGSFVEGQDVKEICVDVVDDGFEFDHVHIYDTVFTSPTDNSDIAFIKFNYSYFQNNSYIRLYNTSTNELIKEFTKNDIGEYRYSMTDNYVVNNDYTNIYIIEDPEHTRVEVSEDILGLHIYVGIYYSFERSLKKEKVFGPWITDMDVINKINYLDMNVLDYYIDGYDLDDGGRIYHVRWKNNSGSSSSK